MHMVEKHLNYRLVLAVLGAMLVFATAVYFVHGYQMGRHARTLLTQAQEAENTGELDKAVTLFQRYLALTPGDTRTLEHRGGLLDKYATRSSARRRVVSIY